MATEASTKLERRVVRAAEDALARRKFVAPIDVLAGLGWLPPPRIDEWRQGRLPHLENGVTANLSKLATVLRFFEVWARSSGLRPSETAYVSQTRDRRTLRFSVSGDPNIERAYRTHWISPELSERKLERLVERESQPPDLVVVSALHDWTCSQCGGTGDFLLMESGTPRCLQCAGLGALVFLPSGDAALTRRAHKASAMSAVVVRFSRARRRYERQGLLVEEAALEQARAQLAASSQEGAPGVPPVESRPPLRVLRGGRASENQ